MYLFIFSFITSHTEIDVKNYTCQSLMSSDLDSITLHYRVCMKTTLCPILFMFYI